MRHDNKRLFSRFVFVLCASKFCAFISSYQSFVVEWHEKSIWLLCIFRYGSINLLSRQLCCIDTHVFFFLSIELFFFWFDLWCFPMPFAFFNTIHAFINVEQLNLTMTHIIFNFDGIGENTFSVTHCLDGKLQTTRTQCTSVYCVTLYLTWFDEMSKWMILVIKRNIFNYIEIYSIISPNLQHCSAFSN